MSTVHELLQVNLNIIQYDEHYDNVQVYKFVQLQIRRNRFVFWKKINVTTRELKDDVMALPLQLSVVSAVHTGTATASKSHC